MKKFITVFSFFLLLSFSISIVTAIAQPKSLSQGIYNVKDLNLLVNTSYVVQNTSPNKVILLVVDGSQSIQELIRLEPNSLKYDIKPLQYDFMLVIIGNGQIIFS